MHLEVPKHCVVYTLAIKKCIHQMEPVVYQLLTQSCLLEIWIPLIVRGGFLRDKEASSCIVRAKATKLLGIDLITMPNSWCGCCIFFYQILKWRHITICIQQIVYSVINKPIMQEQCFVSVKHLSIVPKDDCVKDSNTVQFVDESWLNWKIFH